MSGPDAAEACLRLLHNAAVLSLWGVFGYLAVLVPGDLGRALEHGFARFRVGAVVTAVASVAAFLPVNAAAIGDGWRDAVDVATVRAVLFDTSVGRAWQAQAGAAVLLASTLLLPARYQTVATAGAAGLSLATLALTGHAAMQEGMLGALHRINDVLHVLAGGAWLGALLPLLPTLTALGNPSDRREAAVALRRFSTAGHGAVAIVIATGLINTALVLGRRPTVMSSPYQALLALKILLVAIMTILAIGNRYGGVPRLQTQPGQAIRIIRLCTIAEIGLGAAAIACVSVFGLLDPG